MIKLRDIVNEIKVNNPHIPKAKNMIGNESFYEDHPNADLQKIINLLYEKGYKFPEDEDAYYDGEFFLIDKNGKNFESYFEGNTINIVDSKGNGEEFLLEIKVNQPGGIPKISWDMLKKALIEDAKKTAEELGFEDPEQYVQEFTDNLNGRNYITQLPSLYEDFGFSGEEQVLAILQRLFIK